MGPTVGLVTAPVADTFPLIPCMRLREYTFDRVFGWNPKGWTPPIWKFVKYAHVFAQSVGTCDQLPPSLAFSRVGPLSRLTLASRQKGLCALSRELQLLSYLLAPEPTFLGRLLRPRVPMPRIIPEMFTMNSDEDAGDGGDLPDEREDGAYQEPAVAREPVVEQAPDFHSRYFQGPTRTEFRCLRCDGDRWEVNLYGAWCCCACESTESYSCKRPVRRFRQPTM